MNLLVIGGTSGVGLELVKLALERGHFVTASSRNVDRVELKHPALKLAAGNILKAEDMQRLINGKDAVVSAIGLSAGSSDVTLFSEGAKVILPIMKELGVQRLISISAIGAGDSEGHGGFWFDHLLHPFILEDDIQDKTRQEKLIGNSKLDYTIVRPAILSDDGGQGRYWVITKLDGLETGKIARKDVAHFIMAALEQMLYLRETVILTD